MPVLTALTISIGILAGIAAYLFVGPLGSLGLSLWAMFVAWAAFYHSGGKAAALNSNIPAHLFGAFVGWLALYGIASLAGSLGVPLAAAITVGIGAGAIVYAANIPALAGIPSGVYGFACIAAYTLLAGEDGSKLGALTDFSTLGNPLINIWLSLIIGALFGFVSEKVGGMMMKPAATAAA